MLKSSKFAAYIGVLAVFWAAVTWADTHYVRPPETCTNTTLQTPYTSWANAATNIQWAVTAASAGETVLVSNGTYTLTSQISIARSNILQSVNGRDFTFINGNYPNTTNRCFLITADGVVVDGFTITNGFASSNASVYGVNAGGGGIRCDSSAVIKNCTISQNQAHKEAGGWALGGGGMSLYNYTTVSNCIISYNTILYGSGGGVHGFGRPSLYNCDIFSNKSENSNYDGGGGVSECKLYNCRIYGNLALGMNYGGGVNFPNYTSVIQNCLVRDNYAQLGGGGIGYARPNIANGISGCTIVSNSTLTAGNGGGLQLSGTNTAVYNCIIYNNDKGDIMSDAAKKNYLYFSCTSSTNTLIIYGCTTNAPMFADTNNANYRLRVNSPCVNTGTNQGWMMNAADLDGKPRIRYGTVDMGAYEFINAGAVFSFH